MMNRVCPIDESRINENLTRFNSGAIMFLMVIFVFTPYKWVIVIPALDFFLRLFNSGRFSPVTQINIFIIEKINLEGKMINAGPKRFAAKIGLGMAGVILILFVFNYITAAQVLGIVLILFTFLESFFGICVACKFYPLFYRNKD